MDVPLTGKKFTQGRGNFRSRIDRAFCDTTLLTMVPNLSLKGLPKLSSDHNLLFLHNVECVNWGSEPFRSFDAWFTNASFKPFVTQKSKKLHGLPVHLKLKAIQEPIKEWNKSKFCYIEERLKSYEAEHNRLQIIAEDRDLVEEELIRDNAIKGELHKWKTRRCQLMRQYVRV